MLCLSACGSSDDITEDNCKHIEEIIPGRTATYTETGLTDGKKCSICGKVLVKQSTIPLLKASEGLSFSLNEDKSSYSVSGLGNCTDTELIIPHKYNNLPVTSIHSRAFYGCTQFTIITIPDSITYINYGTFSGCSSLTSITIPNSLTSIGEDAFSGCSSLSSITIPDSVTSIGNLAFYDCSSLTSVTFSNANGWYVTKDSSATHGISMDVKNTSTNATNLKNTLNGYYWKRNS